MNLSPVEIAWLNRAEKREQLWCPVTRWLIVFVGLLSVAGATYIFQRSREFVGQGSEWFVLIAALFLFKAGWMFGVAISRWRGDTQLRLLLKLLRDHQHPDAQPAHPSQQP